MDTVMVDGALVKIHQHSAGAPKADALTTPDASRAAQAIGVIRGGLTAQIVALVEKAGRLAGFALTPGSAREPDSLPALLAGMPASALIANKAYEANAEFRGVATRYGQRALLYSGMLNPASTLVAFGEAASRRPAGGHPAVNRRLAL